MTTPSSSHVQMSVNETLTLTQRIIRMVVGIACMGSIFFTGTTALSGQSLCCLLGIYPMVSGVTGISLLRGSMYAALISNRRFSRALQLLGN